MTIARAVVLTLAAFAAWAAASPLATAASGVSLGQNLAGESCQADGPALEAQTQNVLCGTDTQPAGTLMPAPLAKDLPASGDARRNALVMAAKNVIDPGSLRCDAPVDLDADSVLFACAVESNSWPRIVIAKAMGGTLYVAQGLPSLYPVLEAAIEKASGAPISAIASQAGQTALKAKYPPDIISSKAADFSGYARQIEIGRLAGGADDYAKAETAYRNALAIETHLFGPDSIAVGETLAELALQVSNQSRFEEAAALFQRATPIIQSSGSAASRARLASYLALDAANRRDFSDALKFAEASAAARREDVNNASAEAANGGPPVPPMARGELAHSLRIEAEMALRLGDLAAAQAAADEALWIVSEEPGLPLWWRPDTVALMAEVNAAEGRVVIAERDYKDALDLDRKLFGETAPTARAELMIGQFYSDQQVYLASLESYRQAFAILAKDPVARSEVVPDQIAPFLAAATALYGEHGLSDEVFRASQYAQSDLADQTIARVAAVRAGDDPALASLVAEADKAARARDTARMNLAAEYAKPDDERDSAREQSLDAELKTATADADRLAAQLHASYPAYAELADPGPAELDAVKATLQPDEAFLSYVIGAKESYALLVTRSGLTVRKLAVTDTELAQDVTDLRAAFVPRLGRLADFSVKSSYALYAKLLGPLEGDLASVHHLVVASSGDLANLPFALLVTAEPREGAEHDYVSAAWLVRRVALSQVPSARAWTLLHSEAHQQAPDAFFGIGDPAFTGAAAAGTNPMATLAATCRSDGPISPALLRALPPLPDTKRELDAVGASFGASPRDILTGTAANEAALRAQDLSRYRVLYFATHGLLPGELRCQSEPALVLSPPEQAPQSAADDGLLYASDIAGFHLDADLVVLSACNTAATGGTEMGGGSLEGLADSFFHAGARAVLASHWEVPSASTTKLMTDVFASKGGESEGYAEALREAQLKLIAQSATAHPFHWAAFTLIGDGDGTSVPEKTAERGQ